MRGLRWPFVVALVVGLGLVAAPAIFQMFDRAPKGADMIDGFRPYMSEARIGDFTGYLDVIDAGHDAVADSVPGERPAPYAEFEEEWPAIDADMSEMLDTMSSDVDNFEAVDALPSFDLFPWFFVVPGALIAVVAAWALLRPGAGGGLRIALVVLGLGLVAAPAVFQMFTRAPKGGEMITDFRPYMSTEKLRQIQGYFLTIGTAEGTLRNQLLPALDEPVDAPAIDTFIADWPTISSEFAEMIGTMSNNVDNYAAVDALPPFPLFPWFFVLPGVVVAGAALAAGRRPAAHAES